MEGLLLVYNPEINMLSDSFINDLLDFTMCRAIKGSYE